MSEKIHKTAEQWQQELSPAQFQICRMKGTEAPFTGKYCDTKEPGVYKCSCCGVKLFKSDSKFDSGSGWPSFYDKYDTDVITEIKDTSHGMIRTEVLCSKCDAHLGHVFPDGPQPTGLRYCINSVSLDFEKS